jgi:hypothetical protein
MSNWHARLADRDGNEVRVIMHIPIPGAGLNRAGVQWRTALVKSGRGGATEMLEGVTAGEITTAEKAQITNGELFEYVEQIATHPGETANQLRDRIDLLYPQRVSQVQARLQKELTYWGFDRNVP